MSNPSPQEAASGDFVRTQATYANKLADITFPQLNDLFSQIKGQFAGVGPTGIPTGVAKEFSAAREGVNADFASTSQGTQAFIKQRAKESGAIYSDEMLTSSLEDAAISADRDRQAALDKLQFQEASSGLTSFNQLMDLLGMGAGTGLNLARGASGAQSATLANLSSVSPGQGALTGAVSGAGLGSTFGPWGAIIGGVLGGAGGYLSAGG